MITYSLILFSLTAVGGLLLAAKILMGKQAPWSISIIHALLGASGMVILISTVLEGVLSGRIIAAILLLIIAAVGGFYLASIHLKGKLASKDIIIIHAGVAVAGVLTLSSVVLGL